MKKHLFGGVAALAVGVLATVAAFAAELKLTADNLRYDPTGQTVVAQGHVRISRGASLLAADKGEARNKGELFILSGNVSADLREEKMTLHCGELAYLTKGDGRLIASTDVKVTRGDDVAIEAQFVDWQLGEPARYEARGLVEANWGSRMLKAEEVRRKGNEFEAAWFERFEDKKERLVLTAEKLTGRFDKDVVTEVVASGGVVVETRSKEGKTIRVTGSKGVYSTKKGTVVVTGNAQALQGGRSVKAESLVLRLDSRKIEAVGKPQLIFQVD